MVALALATLPVIGSASSPTRPTSRSSRRWSSRAPAWKWSVAAWAVLPLLSLLGIDDFPTFFFLMLWPIMLGGVMLRIFGEREEVAHAAQRQFALVTERERVARDVHDVLGHSLTALSVKAELAARLVDVDPARAKAELESIQTTARQALAEVRATVGGLRAGNLEAELAAAPLVLADAGIATTVTGDVADTDPRHRALLAWVLRESVTNVVRHARADSVVIELGPRGICVTDDGAGCSGSEGNGLRGMRERVGGVGGTLAISPAPSRARGWRWRCRDPAAARRRPGAGAGRARRAPRPRDRPRGGRAGRPRRRGRGGRTRLGRRGLPARHRDAGPHRHRRGRRPCAASCRACARSS